jgi:hypothetical protein
LGKDHYKINNTHLKKSDTYGEYIYSVFDGEKYYTNDLISSSILKSGIIDVENPTTSIYTITKIIGEPSENFLFYKIKCINEKNHCNRKIGENDKFDIYKLGTYHYKIVGRDLYKNDGNNRPYVYGIYDNTLYYIGDYVSYKGKIYEIKEFNYYKETDEILCILKSLKKNFFSNNLFSVDLIQLVRDFKKAGSAPAPKTKKKGFFKRALNKALNKVTRRKKLDTLRY